MSDLSAFLESRSVPYVALATTEETELYYKLNLVAEDIVRSLRHLLKNPPEAHEVPDKPWLGDAYMTTLGSLVGNRVRKLKELAPMMDLPVALAQSRRTQKGLCVLLNTSRSASAFSSVVNGVWALPFYGAKPADYTSRDLPSILVHEVRHLYDLTEGPLADSNSAKDLDEYFGIPHEHDAFTVQIQQAIDSWLKRTLGNIKSARKRAVEQDDSGILINESALDTYRKTRDELANAFSSFKNFTTWVSVDREKLFMPIVAQFLESATGNESAKAKLRETLRGTYEDLKARYSNMIPSVGGSPLR